MNRIKTTTFTAPRGGIATIMSGIGPQIMLAPENGSGSGGGGDENAAAAAAAAAEATRAAEKAAADQAAADKAAADKAAADKAAADKAAADEKNLSDNEKQLLTEVMDKKAKLKAEKEAREAAEAALKKFEGIDLDKVSALLAAEKKREEQELEAKGEFDRLKAMIAEERTVEQTTWATERASLEAKIQELNGTVDKLTVGQSFSSSTFIAENLVLTPTKARQLYGAHFEMVDGKTVAYNKPAGAADRTILVGADAEPLSFDAALKKIVDMDPEKDTLLKVRMGQGANSKNQHVPPSQQVADQGLTGAARIAAALARRKK